MGFESAIGNLGTLAFGYVLPFLVVLSVIVFVHEYGHFIVGRWCGVDVKTFSIGFGREIFGFTDKHGTRWRFAWIPLGGYVKFAGDADETSQPDFASTAGMSAEERARTFPAKPVWKRAAVVAAGPIANFIFAILVFAALLYVNGRPLLTPRVEAVTPGGAAERAGVRPGDLVISVDNVEVRGFSDLQRIVSTRAGEQLKLVVERKNEIKEFELVPDLRVIPSPLGQQRVGMIGIQAASKPEDWRKQEFGLFESIGAGAQETWFVVTRTGDYLGKLLSGRESTDQLSGPIRIAQASGYVASNSGLWGLINLAAILSVSIGLINLVPIPMLDGGHLLFYGIEALRGRPLSEKAQEMGFRIGLAFVLMLMVFVTWNDIAHLAQVLRPKGA
ncbi:MAG: RIP metalloprotease RseP [Bosea sp. (in: a-proteobacteria)]